MRLGVHALLLLGIVIPPPPPASGQDERVPLTVWYLGHCGFAVEVGPKLLVFDYVSNRGSPALTPGMGETSAAEAGSGGGRRGTGKGAGKDGLRDGNIEPEDLDGRDTYVFVSHPHSDHYDPVVLTWDGEGRRIRYFFGWKAGDHPEHQYLEGPRAVTEVDGLQVYTINSHHSGVPEVAFLIRVGERWIYHNGDYRQDFVADFEYLATLTRHVDLVFHVGLTDEKWQYTSQAYLLLERFRPDAFFPMHFGGEEERGAEFARIMAERGVETRIPVPRRRGDVWTFQ